jgi:hypothetical protein
MTPETPAQTIARLRKWIDDLQSGMYINCVYCGHHYGPKDKVPTSMADALKLHIASCPQHPMHDLLNAAKGAWHMCQSGMTNVSGGHCLITEDLVLEIAEGLQAAIDKAEIKHPARPTSALSRPDSGARKSSRGRTRSSGVERSDKR